MGNLNSRETSQLLDSAEFKHVCKNLGDFFGSHGEYMQHRRRRSRKEGSHREETNRQESKDRGREKSRGLKPELVKNLDWQCPGGGGCPWYKLVTELLRRNPPNARESRRNISQDHPYNERRHSTPYPPQPQRESYPRDTRTRPLPTPQNDPPNRSRPHRHLNQHQSYPYLPTSNDPNFPGPMPWPGPDHGSGPNVTRVPNLRNFQPPYARTASSPTSTAASFSSPLARHHGPPATGRATRSRVRISQVPPPPLTEEYPAHEQFDVAAAGSRRSSSNRGSGTERGGTRGGPTGRERHLGHGAMGFRPGLFPLEGDRRLDPGRVRRKYKGEVGSGVLHPGSGLWPGLGLSESGGGGGGGGDGGGKRRGEGGRTAFWGSPPQVDEEVGEDDRGDGEQAGEPDRDDGVEPT